MEVPEVTGKVQEVLEVICAKIEALEGPSSYRMYSLEVPA